MGYRKEDIERLMTELAALPAVGSAEVNKQQAVRLLARTIQAMQKKGYKLDQIAELVSQRGVNISGKTLKSYLHRVKDRPKAARARSSLRQIVSTVPLAAPARDVLRQTNRASAVGAQITPGAGPASLADNATVKPTVPGTVTIPVIPKQQSVQKTVDAKKASFAPRSDSNDI